MTQSQTEENETQIVIEEIVIDEALSRPFLDLADGLNLEYCLQNEQLKLSYHQNTGS